eukprot:1677173-Amphidinium_carterae.1
MLVLITLTFVPRQDIGRNGKDRQHGLYTCLLRPLGLLELHSHPHDDELQESSWCFASHLASAVLHPMGNAQWINACNVRQTVQQRAAASFLCYRI